MKRIFLFIVFALLGSTHSHAQVSDTSDAFWSIVMPSAAGTVVDMGQAQVGAVKDSVVPAFLTNTGPVAIRIDSMYFSGPDAAAFALVSGIPPFVLPQGGRKAVEFRFRPQAPGAHIATIVVRTQIDKLSYSIRGEGVVPQIEASASLVDFGLVNIGTVKDTSLQAVLHNIGSAPVNISGTVMLGPDTAQFSVLTGGGVFILGPGETRPMQLRFAPVQAGRTSGRIGFYYNGPGSPLIVDLFGEGVGGSGSATLQIDTVTARAGSIVEIPVFLRNARNLNLTGATGFYANLRFHTSLLAPTGNTPKGSISNGYRTIPLDNIPLQADAAGILTRLHFIAMLGDREGTDLLLENAFALRGNVTVTAVPGYFRLDGICREGGERLFQSSGKISLLPNRPNPFNAATLLEYEVIENGPTRLTVLDFLGRTIATLVDGAVAPGRYTIPFDASTLESGTYILILQTPTARMFRLMEVVK
jgi:hypothetical protein